MLENIDTGAMSKIYLKISIVLCFCLDVPGIAPDIL